MLFWKTERKIQNEFENYLQQAEECVALFRKAMDIYFTEGLGKNFTELVGQTHHAEHKADNRRRDIEMSMYDKELIPESRGDIMGMLEAIDLVPNQCESILYQIWTESMVIPRDYHEELSQLIAANTQAVDHLCVIARALFRNPRSISQGASLVVDSEAASDEIERHLLKKIFDSDMEKSDKILLKDLIQEVGAISDRAENASDRLRIISVKRQS
jgi:hypothetical protein